MKLKTVAFIGVGNMGAPMARCARRAGFDLIVCDRNPAVLEAYLGAPQPDHPKAGAR